MSQFFAMGGYATFVWSAYGITALVLTGLLFTTLLRLRRNSRRVAELEAVRQEMRGKQ